MLYESTYNQYFLEHSWGPWKKHLYISRDGESGKYTYKYPKEYYDKYKTNSTRVEGYDPTKRADENAAYYNSYYNNFDKVINRSVKAAVSALNFSADLKQKAEGYLNRFANAVSNAWNKTKNAVGSFASTGAKYLKGAGYLTKAIVKVTAPRVSASIQNLVKGASEAISKGWNRTKDKTSNDNQTDNKEKKPKPKQRAKSSETKSVKVKPKQQARSSETQTVKAKPYAIKSIENGPKQKAKTRVN